MTALKIGKPGFVGRRTSERARTLWVSTREPQTSILTDCRLQVHFTFRTAMRDRNIAAPHLKLEGDYVMVEINSSSAAAAADDSRTHNYMGQISSSIDTLSPTLRHISLSIHNNPELQYKVRTTKVERRAVHRRSPTEITVALSCSNPLMEPMYLAGSNSPHILMFHFHHLLIFYPFFCRRHTRTMF